MGQFVAALPSVHLVGEVFTILCLVHCPTTSRSSWASLDWATLRLRTFVGTAVVDAIMRIDRLCTRDGSSSVHIVHKIAHIRSVVDIWGWRSWNNSAIVYRGISITHSWLIDRRVLNTRRVQAWVLLRSSWTLCWSRHSRVTLGVWLRANASESADSGAWLFVVIMASISGWNSKIALLAAWWISMMSWRLICWMVLNIDLCVCLSKLVQDWPWSFCVDGWNLCHYLAIVCRAISELLVVWTSSCCLVWTDFWRTTTSVGIVIVILVLLCSVWWGVVAKVLDILVIDDSSFLQMICKITKPISITCIQSVSPKLFHLSIGHLFCLFNLLSIQLYSISINSSSSSTDGNIRFISIVHLQITIIVIILLFWFRLAASSCSVCLCDSAFELSYGCLFQFLPHNLFFSEPCIFGLTSISHVHICKWVWSRWMVSFYFGIRILSGVRCRHIKHIIIKFIKIISLGISILTSANSGIFSLDI